jgi:hypothetical protein
MEEEKGLVKKIFWTSLKIESWPSDLSTLDRYHKLEDEGFGMLADTENPNSFDKSFSVVCPSGEILSPKQITNYWNTRGGYSSNNPEDVKMHNARMYYMGFKGE